MTSIFLVWLILLTAAVIVLAAFSARERRALVDRLDHLDLAEQLHVIAKLLTSAQIKRSREIDEQLDKVIDIIGGNQMLVDRYWNDYQELKRLRAKT